MIKFKVFFERMENIELERTTSSDKILGETPKTETEEPPKPVDSLFGRLRKSKRFAVSVIFVATLLDGIYYGILVPLVPIYQEDLQLSDIEIGLLVWMTIFFFLPI